ncbi:hypothetical protein GCM10028816_48450 [Spirosoma lituiforme]
MPELVTEEAKLKVVLAGIDTKLVSGKPTLELVVDVLDDAVVEVTPVDEVPGVTTVSF